MQSLPFPGDVVWIRQQRWRVRRAMRDGHVVRLDVTSRARALTFLAPFDRVVIDRPPESPRLIRRQEARARLANLIARAPDPRLPLTLLDARLQLLPHQIEPVLAALAGHCRLLLADEVGLGKTIQAGGVISEILRREPAPRVLVLVPAALVAQWIDELGHRFHLTAERADREGLQSLTRVIPYGENPWRRGRLWIGSPDFIKQPHVFASLPRDAWDLLVIDEAHAVCGDSDRYDACAAIARHSRRVLSLTATPHGGDEQRFNRLMALGALPGSPPPIVFRRTRASLGMPPARAIRWPRIPLTAAEHDALACLRAYEQAVLAACGDGSQSPLLLLSVFRKRALSTFASLGVSAARRLAWLGDGREGDVDFWDAPLPFAEDTDDAEVREQDALRAALSIDPRREALWLRRLQRLAAAGARSESKARFLASLIHRTTEPVVVFSEFRDSLEAVMHHVRVSRSVAWIHGRQDAREQKSQLDRFLRGDASVLLATDVAGQGLNLQSRARWVVSLEVPWNPARLEQRIGRVDRISQRRPTHLTVLVARHEAESGLLLHLAQRIARARSAFSDDVLIDAPSDADLAAMLLDARALAHGAGAGPGRTVMPSSHRLRRAGRVVAFCLEQRRRLARFWRQPLPSADCPNAISRDAARCQHGGRLVVMATPVLNGLDEMVAMVITPASVSVTAARAGLRRCTSSIEAIARRQVRRRLARLRAWWARASARQDARDLQIIEVIQEGERVSEVQAGLFDRRQLDVHDELLSDVATIAAGQRAAIERRAAAATFRPSASSALTITLPAASRDPE